MPRSAYKPRYSTCFSEAAYQPDNCCKQSAVTARVWTLMFHFEPVDDKRLPSYTLDWKPSAYGRKKTSDSKMVRQSLYDDCPTYSYSQSAHIRRAAAMCRVCAQAIRFWLSYSLPSHRQITRCPRPINARSRSSKCNRPASVI